MAAEVKTIRLLPEDWALFRQFKERLQAGQALGKISNREAFVFAVSGSLSALDREQMATTRPPTDKVA
jgi:hypothetical protein